MNKPWSAARGTRAVNGRFGENMLAARNVVSWERTTLNLIIVIAYYYLQWCNEPQLTLDTLRMDVRPKI